MAGDDTVLYVTVVVVFAIDTAQLTAVLPVFVCVLTGFTSRKSMPQFRPVGLVCLV